MFVVSVCMLLPAVISVLCDWRINGRITWSGFAVGGLVLLYILAALPMWYKRPDPVIFVPVDFAAIALFLLYVNYATGGHWYLSFALPVTGAAALLVCAMVTLLKYLPGAALYICGGALILSGVLAVLVEFLLNLTFGLHDTFLWSIYPLAVGVVLGAMLLVIAVANPCAGRCTGNSSCGYPMGLYSSTLTIRCWTLTSISAGPCGRASPISG